ncbi:uncharacterized protein LOC127129601 [Lathyrus oleraceus]|uniref:uncharacterized protein LOC127129601 n=1 Tax=Pisum sativum TaxID=3888 RepID=UPI0021D18202|nr:uncharacterized protein LOC127129601 [Pisum sativum]
MTALARREDNIQRTIVIENAIPPQVNNLAQTQPVQIPVEDQIIQEHPIVRDRHSSYDAIEYHSFVVSAQNSQGEVPVTKPKYPRHVEVAEIFQVLEEKLKAIEGQDAFGLNTSDMCLVLGLIMPSKFKAPDFEKYRGDSCPKKHLVMFCRKFTSYAHSDKLMIHCFQDSLSGESLSWYMQLEKCHIQSWLDLANAFLKQYTYNLDMAPSRTQLQGLSKESNESFRGYAQRWRELAAQVQPPLLEKELVDLFMDTLQVPYYEKMIGSTSPDFSRLVSAGIRIEGMLKSGKI